MKTVLFSLLVLVANLGWAQNSAPGSVVVALKPDKNPEAMVKERQELEKHLSRQLKKPVKVIIPLSGAVIQEGLSNGTIDLAFVSGLEMVKSEQTQAAELLLVVEIDGKTEYESYWVTLKDKPYDSVEDLKGKSVAFASRTSTSGYLIPMYDLVKNHNLKEKAKPEDYFGKGHVSFGTGYVSAIERVLQGQAEAAAVSDYVINKDKHLNAEQKAKLKVMAKQGPLPTHILAVRKTLAPETKKALEAALLDLNKKPELRDQVFTGKLVKSNSEKHLAGLRDALNKTGISLE